MPSPKDDAEEPTADEKRNGWTAESLREYRAMSNEDVQRFFDHKPTLPSRSHGKLRPQRWRNR